MSKNSLFRNSLSGYNKDDVQRYIDDLNVRFTEREDELEAQIKSLKKELEILPELKAEKEKAQKLEKELDVLKKENSDLSCAIAAQGNELETKSGELENSKSENLTLKAKVDELKRENESFHADYSDKIKELKKLSDETEELRKNLDREKAAFEERVEAMLLEIQSQAELVIEKANETAEMIVANAKKKADENVSKAPVRESQFTYTEKKKDNLSEMLDSHKGKMDNFFSSIIKAFKS